MRRLLAAMAAFLALATGACCGPLLCGTCTADREFGYQRCCFSCVEWPNSRPCKLGADVGGWHGGDWYEPKTARWVHTPGHGVSLVADGSSGKHHPEVCACPPSCTCWRGVFLGIGQPGRERWASGQDLRTD
jgi:hypothetical protein